MTTFENLESDFKRLFPAIPRPDPLGMGTVELEEGINTQMNHRCVAVMKWISREEAEAMFDPVDADETNHGPCAQGDCSDE
jgi:hypothetical protein